MSLKKLSVALTLALASVLWLAPPAPLAASAARPSPTELRKLGRDFGLHAKKGKLKKGKKGKKGNKGKKGKKHRKKKG